MSRKLPSPEGDFYYRNLPHWQPENAVLFMTTRLYGSLPQTRIEELKQWKEDREQILRSKGLSEKELAKALGKC